LVELLLEEDKRQAAALSGLLAGVHARVAYYSLRRSSRETSVSTILDDRTVLHLAQSPAMVDLLCRYGADVNALALEEQGTPLHVTFDVAVASALIRHGADTLKLNKHGKRAPILSLLREFPEARSS
jgi:hypothetical protein